MIRLRSTWTRSTGVAFALGRRALCALPTTLLLFSPACSRPLLVDPEPERMLPTEQNAGERDATGHRVVICGHLYSLYSRNKIQDPNELVYSERYLKAFAAELALLNPDATYFLGDSVRFSKAAEWALLARTFDEVPGAKVWVAGNHEVKDFETFRAAGGVHNSSMVVGRSKFITLDAKIIFEAEDLAFIERELADWEDFESVFIMMHLFPFRGDIVDPDTDPYQSYSNGSTWNADVLPIIAGKVKYVFTGDYFSRHVGRFVQQYKEHEIHYIRNAFLFRRGRSDDSTGDGPMTYLVLDIDENGSLSMTPRVLPIDLRDTWYRNFGLSADGPAYEEKEEEHAIKPDWRRYPFKCGLSVGFPAHWKVLRGKGDLMYTAWQYRDKLGIRARMFSYANTANWTEDEFREQLIAVAEKDRDAPLNIEREGKLELDDGLTVHWTLSESFTGEESTLSLNCYFLGKNRCFLLVCSTEDALPDYRSKLESLVEMFDLCRQLQFEPL